MHRGILAGLVIGAAALVGGCATAYQKDGLTGGYDEQRLDGGVWRVRYGGNGYKTFRNPVQTEAASSVNYLRLLFPLVGAD